MWSRNRFATSMVRMLVVLAAAALLAAPVAAKPTVSLAEPVKDFAIIAKGDKIDHSFAIRNEGDEPLEISDVRPACGCTVADFDKIIAPGKVGYVKAVLDTSTFDGPIAKSIAVFTNDAENPKLQLVIKAEVRPFIGVDPGYARFNYVQGEKTGSVTQSLWAPDGTDFSVVGVKVPYDHLDVTFHEASADERVGEVKGKQWRVEIGIKGDAPVGALRDYVELQVDHPRQKVVKIAVSGFVRPRQHLTPQVLDFGDLESDALPSERAFTLVNFITEGIELTEIETGVEGIEYEITSNEDDGHRFQVTLRATSTLPKGAFASTVRIHTTDASNPVIEVPLKGKVL